MSKTTIIPQTTIRYYDRSGTYREQRFNVKEELEAFERRAAAAGIRLIEL
jgi:hypothetical protein